MSENNIENQISNLEKLEKDLEEKQLELEKKKSEIENYEEQKEAILKEFNRIKQQLTELREARRMQEKDYLEGLKKENFEKAKEKFLKQYGNSYDDSEKMQQLLQEFEKIGGKEAINEENIYKCFQKAHLLLNSDVYIDLEKRFSAMKNHATEFQSQQSTSAILGHSEKENQNAETELTEEDIEAAKWAGLPIEVYKELKAKGKI